MAVVDCATEGCDQQFEKRSELQTYCPSCDMLIVRKHYLQGLTDLYSYLGRWDKFMQWEREHTG